MFRTLLVNGQPHSGASIHSPCCFSGLEITPTTSLQGSGHEDLDHVHASFSPARTRWRTGCCLLASPPTARLAHMDFAIGSHRLPHPHQPATKAIRLVRIVFLGNVPCSLGITLRSASQNLPRCLLSISTLMPVMTWAVKLGWDSPLALTMRHPLTTMTPVPLRGQDSTATTEIRCFHPHLAVNLLNADLSHYLMGMVLLAYPGSSPARSPINDPERCSAGSHSRPQDLLLSWLCPAMLCG